GQRARRDRPGSHVGQQPRRRQRGAPAHLRPGERGRIGELLPAQHLRDQARPHQVLIRRRRIAATGGQVDAPSEAERTRALELLERFGSNANSSMVRYPAAWRYFFATAAEGAVCYLRIERTVVAWGDPLCAAEDTGAVLEEFLSTMRTR